jgi:phosphate transport system protein
LDILTIAKSIERIGDHAKNIAEFIIYVVGGDDLRHTPKSELMQRVSE